MAKAKIKSVAIKMISSAGTGFFYVTSKNPRTVVRKLSLKKVRQYEPFHKSLEIQRIKKLFLVDFSSADPVS